MSESGNLELVDDWQMAALQIIGSQEPDNGTAEDASNSDPLSEYITTEIMSRVQSCSEVTMPGILRAEILSLIRDGHEIASNAGYEDALIDMNKDRKKAE